jgi:predicted DNA-binding transcriptional regulator AlpA
MSSTKFNIKDAAKLYGMSRNTIYKALQEGRLSKKSRRNVGVCRVVKSLW